MLQNEGPQGNSQEAGKRSVQPQLSGLLRHVLNLHGPVSRLQEILDGAVVEMRNRCATIRLSRAVGHWGVSGMDSQSAGGCCDPCPPLESNADAVAADCEGLTDAERAQVCLRSSWPLLTWC